MHACSVAFVNTVLVLYQILYYIDVQPRLVCFQIDKIEMITLKIHLKNRLDSLKVLD